MHEELPADVRGAGDLPALIRAVKAALPGTGAVQEALVNACFDISDRDVTRLIMACRNPKLWRKAIEVLDVARQGSLMEGRVQPNFFTYSAAISVCCKCRRVGEANRLLEEMKAAAEKDPSMQPDSVVYRLMVSCCAKEGKQERVLELNADMKRMGVEADDQTLLCVMSAFVELREWAKAADVLDKIHSRLGPLPVCWYAQFIAGCAAHGNLDMAIEIFLSMQMMEVEPEASTCHHVMTAIEATGQAHLGVQLLQEMLSSGVKLPMKTYASLVRVVVQSETPELVSAVNTLVAHHGGECWMEEKATSI